MHFTGRRVKFNCSNISSVFLLPVISMLSKCAGYCLLKGHFWTEVSCFGKTDSQLGTKHLLVAKCGVSVPTFIVSCLRSTLKFQLDAVVFFRMKVKLAQCHM